MFARLFPFRFISVNRFIALLFPCAAIVHEHCKARYSAQRKINAPAARMVDANLHVETTEECGLRLATRRCSRGEQSEVCEFATFRRNDSGPRI